MIPRSFECFSTLRGYVLRLGTIDFLHHSSKSLLFFHKGLILSEGPLIYDDQKE